MTTRLKIGERADGVPPVLGWGLIGETELRPGAEGIEDPSAGDRFDRLGEVVGGVQDRRSDAFRGVFGDVGAGLGDGLDSADVHDVAVLGHALPGVARDLLG